MNANHGAAVKPVYLRPWSPPTPPSPPTVSPWEDRRRNPWFGLAAALGLVAAVPRRLFAAPGRPGPALWFGILTLSTAAAVRICLAAGEVIRSTPAWSPAMADHRAAAAGLAVVGLLLAPIGAAAILSLWAGWVHLGLRATGRVMGGWTGTIRVVGYSAGLGLVAAYPTGWALVAALVWMLVVQTIGLMTVHRVGFFRLAAATAVSLIGAVILVMAGFHGLVLFIGQLSGQLIGGGG